MARSIIIGAGMVGLATAWHLQEHGVSVTVVDRAGVAADASWGNAGWLAPGKTIPLADSSVWTYGPKALVDPNAALHIPLRMDPALWSFLARFAAHGTQRAWERAMAALAPINAIALECFDELRAGGVDAWTREGAFVIGFAAFRDARPFLREIEGVKRHGLPATLTRIERPADACPVLSDKVQLAYHLEGQRFIEPAAYLHALAESVVARGGVIRTDAEVTAVEGGQHPAALLADGSRLDADSVVVSTGAHLPRLTRRFGVRTRVQAGRGYSFTVATDEPVTRPLYLPKQRIACTPVQGRLRIAGTMEFRGADDPLQQRRIESIVNQARALLRGVDLDDRRDEWVGSRPVTPDGLPLVGATRAPGVYVGGGHGMWGIVLGPATGKLLARQIATGVVDPIIAPFDPLRG
ncbi:MAG: FAD-dependent oxidoreductase [Thermoleophilia bacterium]|nr:FAD-dependent oxidoreductase [Thermoleophilia bacterium]